MKPSLISSLELYGFVPSIPENISLSFIQIRSNQNLLKNGLCPTTTYTDNCAEELSVILCIRYKNPAESVLEHSLKFNTART